MTLEQELAKLLNRHSAENGSDTPDFILADYLTSCLAALNATIRSRSTWYGRHDKPRATAAAPSASDHERAAQCWCLPETSGIEMDVRLANAITAALSAARAEERERCAKVADAHYAEHKALRENMQAQINKACAGAAMVCAQDIAAAIREQP